MAREFRLIRSQDRDLFPPSLKHGEAQFQTLRRATEDPEKRKLANNMLHFVRQGAETLRIEGSDPDIEPFFGVIGRLEFNAHLTLAEVARTGKLQEKELVATREALRRLTSGGELPTDVIRRLGKSSVGKTILDEVTETKKSKSL